MPGRPSERDVTPREVFRGRRRFLRGTAWALGAGLIGGAAWLGYRRVAVPDPAVLPPVPPDVLTSFPGTRAARLGRGLTLTPKDVAGAYNNFYEFSENKDDVAERARGFVSRPWTVELAGECHRPGVLDVWDLVRRLGVEERIYRHRCVEAWSMVVPWNGFPLASLLSLAQPTSHARYVRFVSFDAPDQAPNQRGGTLPWPYHEGLRLDEALHPLAFLAVGIYGEILPAQHGAPLRLVVPWKYGYKSAKSIVRVELVREQPATFWSTVAPSEYGFESNVDPMVPHPRWSQASERVLGTDELRPTLLLNGYVEEVAPLYRG